MKLSIAVLSLTLAQVVLAGEWRFDGGVCRGGEDGTFEIETAGGKFTLGAYSMIIKLFAHDDKHLMYLLNSQIQTIPGIANTETLTILDESINRALPIEQLPQK